MNRRMERVAALEGRKAQVVQPYRKPRQKARAWSPVVQPREYMGPRFPMPTLDYGGVQTIAQAAGPVTLVTFNVPEHVGGVLKELTIACSLDAGLTDLTEYQLYVDSVPQLGELVSGNALASLVLHRPGYGEPCVIKLNVQLKSQQLVELVVGRVAAVDPTSYTYLGRLQGWYWPRRG